MVTAQTSHPWQRHPATLSAQALWTNSLRHLSQFLLAVLNFGAAPDVQRYLRTGQLKEGVLRPTWQQSKALKRKKTKMSIPNTIFQLNSRQAPVLCRVLSYAQGDMQKNKNITSALRMLTVHLVEEEGEATGKIHQGQCLALVFPRNQP